MVFSDQITNFITLFLEDPGGASLYVLLAILAFQAQRYDKLFDVFGKKRRLEVRLLELQVQEARKVLGLEIETDSLTMKDPNIAHELGRLSRFGYSFVGSELALASLTIAAMYDSPNPLANVPFYILFTVLLAYGLAVSSVTVMTTPSGKDGFSYINSGAGNVVLPLLLLIVVSTVLLLIIAAIRAVLL